MRAPEPVWIFFGGGGGGKSLVLPSNRTTDRRLSSLVSTNYTDWLVLLSFTLKSQQQQQQKQQQQKQHQQQQQQQQKLCRIRTLWNRKLKSMGRYLRWAEQYCYVMMTGNYLPTFMTILLPSKRLPFFTSRHGIITEDVNLRLCRLQV